MEVVLFEVDEVPCGLDVLAIQEIKKVQSHTALHRGPPYVRGLVNLRGQIITLIDVRERLGLAPRPLDGTRSAIIVSAGEELVGLPVDTIGDVISAAPEQLRPPPSNLKGLTSRFVTDVLLTDAGLVALLDKERLAHRERAQAGG